VPTHRPEASLLYQIIEQHWPQFQAALARQSKHLPKFVMQEFEEYLQCGRLDMAFCESDVSHVMTKNQRPLAARNEASVQAAARDA
jgi:elongation factor P--beta-lysine ligase